MHKVFEHSIKRVTIVFHTDQETDALMLDIENYSVAIKWPETVTVRETRTLKFSSREPKKGVDNV